MKKMKKKVLMVLLSLLSTVSFASDRTHQSQEQTTRESTLSIQQIMNRDFIVATTVTSATNAAVITSKTTIIAKRSTRVG